MCGRTACTLNPEEICRACPYTSKSGKQLSPLWIDAPGSQQYYPGYNKSPTSYLPVMTYDEKHDEMTIRPMLWGLIPHWYKGESPTGHKLSTNNCRIESLKENKPMFSYALKRSGRCVFLTEGYYEWKTEGNNKQPYLLYGAQREGVTIGDRDSWESDVTSDNIEWKGPALLTIAGIYNTWSPIDSNEEIYNFTIVTMPSSKNMEWLHHRMPAVLDNEADLRMWLDNSWEPEKAVNDLKSSHSLQYHPVSTVVNNSRNDVKECVLEIDLKKPTKANPSANLMMSWLKKGKKPDEDEQDGKSPNKKIKKEKE